MDSPTKGQQCGKRSHIMGLISLLIRVMTKIHHLVKFLFLFHMSFPYQLVPCSLVNLDWYPGCLIQKHKYVFPQEQISSDVEAGELMLPLARQFPWHMGTNGADTHVSFQTL